MPRAIEAPVVASMKEKVQKDIKAYEEITETTFNPDEVVQEAIKAYKEITGTTFNPNEEINEEDFGESYKSLPDNTRKKKFIFRFMETQSFKTLINKDEVKMLIALDYEIYKARGDPPNTYLEQFLIRLRKDFIEILHTKYVLLRKMRTTFSFERPVTFRDQSNQHSLEEVQTIPDREEIERAEAEEARVKAKKEAAREEEESVALLLAGIYKLDENNKVISEWDRNKVNRKVRTFFKKCGLEDREKKQPYLYFSHFKDYLKSTINGEFDTKGNMFIIFRRKVSKTLDGGRFLTEVTAEEIILLASMFLYEKLYNKAYLSIQLLYQAAEAAHAATSESVANMPYAEQQGRLILQSPEAAHVATRIAVGGWRSDFSSWWARHAEEQRQLKEYARDIKFISPNLLQEKELRYILEILKQLFRTLINMSMIPSNMSENLAKILKQIIVYLDLLDNQGSEAQDEDGLTEDEAAKLKATIQKSKRDAIKKLIGMKKIMKQFGITADMYTKGLRRVGGGGYRKTRRKTRRKTKRKTQRRNQRKTKRKTKKIIKDRTKSKRSTSDTRRKRR